MFLFSVKKRVVYTLGETETVDRESGEGVRHLVLGALYMSKLRVELGQEIQVADGHQLGNVGSAVSSRAGRHGKARRENGILVRIKKVGQAEGDSRRQTRNSQPKV